MPLILLSTSMGGVKIVRLTDQAAVRLSDGASLHVSLCHLPTQLMELAVYTAYPFHT